MPLPTLLVHGGAGIYGDETLPEALAGVRTAAAIGFSALRGGATAVEAVIAAVQALEDDPRFNAGKGSTLTADGTVENDASVMSGDDLSAGAVAALSGFANPILIAEAVRRDGRCLLIAGDGAKRFALSQGFQDVDPRDLATAAQRARWEEERIKRATHPRQEAAASEKLGTVGAVACDSRGHVAAATSTGGLLFKVGGRVGDTPIIGAGTYADDLSGAASCTGHGEAILKIGMARIATDQLRTGATAQEAAQAAVRALTDRVNGLGGIIVVSPRGDLGVAFNTERMSRAYCDSSLAEPIASIDRA